MSSSGTSSGVQPCRAANAAAAPAACPFAIQVACTRKPELAKRSLLMLRPATIRFRLPLGTNARNGTVAGQGQVAEPRNRGQRGVQDCTPRGRIEQVFAPTRLPAPVDHVNSGVDAEPQEKR